MKTITTKSNEERLERLEDIDVTVGYLKNCIWWFSQDSGKLTFESTKKQALAHIEVLKNKIENLQSI